jgi:hypothetical protein
MSDFKLYSVNWQDGMLISQAHLHEQQAYFETLHRWYAATAGNGFGLVKRTDSAEPALSLHFAVNGPKVRVELQRCQAVLPGGHWVEINPSSENMLTAEAAVPEDGLDVYLSVSPRDKQPVGQPDPHEDIPRLPYLVTRCQLHLGAAPSLPQADFLQVARIVSKGTDVALDAEFFPPCVTISADEHLAARSLDIRNRLESVMSLSSRAYNAIASAGALSNESSSLQVAFKDTMYHLAIHLASSLDDFTVGRSGGHPLSLVIACKKLFRVFATSLNLRPGLRDYLNEKFFVKQQNSEVGRFIAETESFLLSEYDHRDIGGQIKKIDRILTAIRGIVGFLAQLKGDQLGPQAVATDSLTYMGKTYHNADYGSNRSEAVGDLSYLLIDLPSARQLKDMVVLLSKELFSVAEWNNMQVRLGLNDARGLGETDPVDVDSTTYGDKVALHPQDMLSSAAVGQITLVFRGVRQPEEFAGLTKSDLIVYCV